MSQGLLPFVVELSSRPLNTTAYAGLPLTIEALRSLGPKNDYRRQRNALHLHNWKVVRRHVESLVLLIASGGDCLDDLDVLRADTGLCKLVGFVPSSPTQAKDFLYRFHQNQDGRPLTPEDDASLSTQGKAQIRPEGPGLCALRGLVKAVVDRLQFKRLQRRATLDIDATIIEARKRTALRTYEGTTGYQPQMAWWAEQSVWNADEFRDGNVNAEFRACQFLQRAFEALPSGVTERRLRADSALYNEEALSWADEQGIEFAVSADMSLALAKAVSTIHDQQWQPYRSLDSLKDKEEDQPSREERQWAEVLDFVPDWKRNRHKDGNPFRYIAIRVRARQTDLLVPQDESWRHFAVVTNMDWNGERLLRWHREKQGTVEHGHHVLKNELAAGTMPCRRFGSNAAWLRLNVLVHNLLELVKAVALPQEMRSCRPKALRFRLFNVVGRLIQTGHQLILRLAEGHPFTAVYIAARTKLLALASECAT